MKILHSGEQTISQIRVDFSHLGVIWREVINHIKYLERERTDNVRSLCMCKKENDRGINEWYNEEKRSDRLEIFGGMYEQETAETSVGRCNSACCPYNWYKL